MNFLNPQVFDFMVIGVMVIGVVASAIRIYGDFKKGPRWPEDTFTASDDSKQEPKP